MLHWTGQTETVIIYAAQESFEIGQVKVVHHSVNGKVTVIGAGVTLHEMLAAAKDLSKQGISIWVIDLFTVKSLHAAAIISDAKSTGGSIITVEDHHPESGIREAVIELFPWSPASWTLSWQCQRAAQ